MERGTWIACVGPIGVGKSTLAAVVARRTGALFVPERFGDNAFLERFYGPDGIKRWGLDGFKPGDILIMNHGETCGQHLNNVVLYAPCFVNGELVAFAANRAHWVDIGGMRIGFGSSLTTEIFAEGLQMRSLKIYEAGVRNETLWQIIHDNVRFPDACLGDMRAQIASCQLGARRYGELVSRYTRPVVEACIDRIWDQADMQVRSVIEKIPDGVYVAESALDNDGRNLDQPIKIKTTVTIEGSTMTVDFSEMNPQTHSPLNSGKSGGIAAARVAFKAITSPDLDVNEGCFRALDVVIPEGTIVSARPGAAAAPARTVLFSSTPSARLVTFQMTPVRPW
jgi:N-methylhydantoinase B